MDEKEIIINGELLNEIYTDIEEGTDTIPKEDSYDKAEDSLNRTLGSKEILRIEEYVTRSYSGVRSCGHKDRIQAVARDAMNDWAAKKMLEYRDLRWIRYGHLGGKARWYNGRRASGARYCRGSVNIKCYIEFRKIK